MKKYARHVPMDGNSQRNKTKQSVTLENNAARKSSNSSILPNTFKDEKSMKHPDGDMIEFNLLNTESENGSR